MDARCATLLSFLYFSSLPLNPPLHHSIGQRALRDLVYFSLYLLNLHFLNSHFWAMASPSRKRSRSSSILRSAEIAHAACADESDQMRRRHVEELDGKQRHVRMLTAAEDQKVKDTGKQVELYVLAQREAIKTWAANPGIPAPEILSHCIDGPADSLRACSESPSLWVACDSAHQFRSHRLLAQMKILEEQCIRRAMHGYGDIAFQYALEQQNIVRRFLLIWTTASNHLRSIYADEFVQREKPSDALCNLMSVNHCLDWEARDLLKIIAKHYVQEIKLVRRRIMQLPASVANLVRTFVG